jgi:HK97 family phage major capsid protein
VARGQRFRDHELVREQLARHSGHDNAIIGQYGDIGQQMRALTTSTGSAIVPTVWAADIIDRARNYAAVMQAGAVTVPIGAKIVQIGRLTADPAAGFRTEGSTITASDPTFDNVTLTAKTLNALVVGSTEFWQDASNAGDLVTEAMARALAVQIDLVALFGGVTAGAEQTATGNNMLLSGGLPNPPNPTVILANLLANASSSVLGGQTNGTVQTAATFYGEVLDTLYTPRDFNESPNAMLWPSHLARIYAN